MTDINRKYVTMDGNEAAAYIAYAFTEIAAIYPITPSSPMAGKTDVWAAKGRKNLFGQTVQLVEMQSEAGAIAAVHGALETGALATSYTSSQGLMLMLPVMHRIAGQRHPGVLHVASRTVGTHALSIFGDHSDVMNCRATGFAMLCTGSVQEVMDLAGVAHLAAIKGRVPFLHFFDGFRTSHEINKIEQIDYEDLRGMLDMEAVGRIRAHALNPEHPLLRSTVQNPDIYFQIREANNLDYTNLPDIVEDYMGKINALTGRDYHLFNYYGAPDADRVVIAMGSVSGCAREVVDYLNAAGEKVGYVQVHLYRPFDTARLREAIPESCRAIAVLDRTKEMGSAGDPLYLDVCEAFRGRADLTIVGGRYGLSSKDTTPGQIFAVYENLKQAKPVNSFCIGIEDDVTHLSLPEKKDLYPETEIPAMYLFVSGFQTPIYFGDDLIGVGGDMYLGSDYYPGNTKTAWFEPYLRNLSLTLPHGRNYYEVWPFLMYISYNPDDLPGLGINAVKRIISEAKPYEYPFDTITRLFGTDSQTMPFVLNAFFFVVFLIFEALLLQIAGMDIAPVA